MPRIRTVKPELFQSESLGRASREARFLFVGLLTLADDEGRMRWIPKSIAGALFPWDEDVETPEINLWVAELEKEGSVRRYRVGPHDYLWIPEWARHQRIDHPTPSRFPAFEDAREEFGDSREASRVVASGFSDPSDLTYETGGDPQKKAPEVVVPSATTDDETGGDKPESETESPAQDPIREEFGDSREEFASSSENFTIGNRKKEKGNRISFGPPKADPQKRRRRFPDDFVLTDSLRECSAAQKASKAGINLDSEFEKFRDYHLGKGSLMLDWAAAWRTWCGNALRWAPREQEQNPFLAMMREGK